MTLSPLILVEAMIWTMSCSVLLPVLLLPPLTGQKPNPLTPPYTPNPGLVPHYKLWFVCLVEFNENSERMLFSSLTTKPTCSASSPPGLGIEKGTVQGLRALPATAANVSELLQTQDPGIAAQGLDFRV